MKDEQCCAAQTPPSTRAWRFKRFFVVRAEAAGFAIKLLFLRLAYRHLMRFTHYFGWHYAPLKGPYPGGEYHRWCHWCGMRGSVYDGPLKASPNAASAARRKAVSIPNEFHVADAGEPEGIEVKIIEWPKEAGCFVSLNGTIRVSWYEKPNWLFKWIARRAGWNWEAS